MDGPSAASHRVVMSGAHESGEVVLITGASSGFGLLTAVELARRGLRVFASMRDPSRQAPLHATARAAGIEVEVVVLDVTRPATIAAALADIRARAGGVDILINNAGIGLIGAFEDTDEVELRTLFETNFFGLGAVTRAVIPEMRARGRGRIVNVASMSGRIGAPAAAGYSASKFAVEGLSEALSHELAPFGIDVVIVEPGTFATELIGPQKRRWTTRAGDPASPYRALCSALTRTMQKGFERGHPDPNAVALAIAHAATAMHPRLRYPVGNDAQVLSLLRGLLPARRFERVFRWLLRRATSGD
ncbi:SDR family oxidoreductase [Nannocystis punicea]|uniref:SDR family oxidoreductase n=1 Tax=Nannocystis punicea TaxID=2995304 RepID=A0ABY7HCA5_9BACT|nr:SDR family oxidoreductase [Nannocystis poenicansa]WAS96738.1 SDR family oxidoreductase [Nannocystis poenicansa]